MKIKPKNWNEYQQYKDRKPTWIKFHRDLLNDFAYSSVQIGTKAVAPLLLLLASEFEDGVIDCCLDEICFRIHIDKKTVESAIKQLLEIGFFICLDKNVQECTGAYENVPREEKRREEKRYEKKDDFSLSKKTSYDNLSTEYKENLETFLRAYIEDLELKILDANSNKKTLAYDDFILALESKGYQYKNFVSAYITWNRKA